jgi:hypothetical protein
LKAPDCTKSFEVHNRKEVKEAPLHTVGYSYGYGVTLVQFKLHAPVPNGTSAALKCFLRVLWSAVLLMCKLMSFGFLKCLGHLTSKYALSA